MHAMNRTELEELVNDAESSFLLVNVLGKDDFDRQHIPGSVNIPLKDPTFAQQVEAANSGKERTVVVYCAGPECDASTKAATELEAEGFSSVYDYEGGTADWFGAR
ncbi:rhodanese-like domain-containing protein [Gilvimarinus sp. F26214L]|uniref:rhodanese-like domain-containing protein n=1 Tax=Gilvimarinus sp. DZF01 TaxID=3461371 RepID=UPI0040465B8C